jgi:hypothetical protein
LPSRRELLKKLGGMSAIDPKRTFAAAASKSWKLVKEKIDGRNLAVPGDDEIGSGVSRRLARAARHPADPSAVADHLRRGERLISEVRMSSLDHARDAVDLVATTVSAIRFVEYGVFVEDLVDCCGSTHGINLSEHVMEVAKQQGRYSVRHGLSRVGIEFGLHGLVRWTGKRQGRFRKCFLGQMNLLATGENAMALVNSPA